VIFLRKRLLLLGIFVGSASLQAAGGSTLLDRYQAVASATQLEQPQWAAPLITVSPRIEQGFRADFVRQSLSQSQTTWNLGSTKGLQLIPFRRVELRFSPPTFLIHSNPGTEDGFGDVGMRVKYRVYSSPAERRNAIATIELAASVPTGKSGNGSCCAVLYPAFEVAKGWRALALTLSAAGSLPVTGTQTLGRQILLNEAVQYHASKLLWVETEFNSALFRGGKNDNREQTFITPGMVLSRIDLRKKKGTAPAPLLFTVGAGEQIALTHFNTYNHAPVITGRLRF
jgi:hypothetical protein